MPMDFSPMRMGIQQNYDVAAINRKSIYDDMLRQRQQQDEMARLQQQQQDEMARLAETYRLRGKEFESQNDLKSPNVRYKLLLDAHNNLISAASRAQTQAEAQALYNQAEKFRSEAESMLGGVGVSNQPRPMSGIGSQRADQAIDDLENQWKAIGGPQSSIPSTPIMPQASSGAVSAGPRKSRMENDMAGRLYMAYAARETAAGRKPKDPDVWYQQDFKNIDIDTMAAIGDTRPRTQEQAESIQQHKQEQRIQQERAVIQEKSMAEARKNLLGVNKVKSIVATMKNLWDDTEPVSSSTGATLSGAVRSVSGPLAPKSKLYTDYTHGLASIFSKYVGVDSGALSEGDVARSTSLAPTLTDTKETGNKKIEMLGAILELAENSQRQIIEQNMSPAQVRAMQEKNGKEIDSIISAGGANDYALATEIRNANPNLTPEKKQRLEEQMPELIRKLKAKRGIK